MANQAKISSFFSKSPKSVKEKVSLSTNKPEITEEKENETVEPAQKKLKHADDMVPSLDIDPSLSSDERNRMELSKTKAKLKLLSTKSFGQICNFGPSWFTALEKELNKPYIIELSQFVANERKKASVYPPVDQVFSWTTACPIDSVKVVIIGQDPYHGPKQAHGLCFSVLPGIKTPPSLVNMYKELEKSIEGFEPPGHGNLSGWAKQGVLLLNACLTVRGGAANSHAGKGWEKLTDAAIQWLNAHASGVVFMLWGSYAQKKGSFIKKKKHHVLTAVHPSPLSAHRGFFGCNHFLKCNSLLEEAGKTPIDWKHLPKDLLIS